MKKKLFGFLCLIFCFNAYSLSPEKEYDYLLKDLENCGTTAYKTTFDSKSCTSKGKISFTQGALKSTNLYTDIAVMGNGCFKVLDNKGNEFYTRYGELKITKDSKLAILCNNATYYLDLSPLPQVYILDTIKITRDGTVTCQIFNDSSSKTVDIGKIILYNITEENIISYDGYLIKTKKTPSKATDSFLIQGFLEWSNVPLEAILIRMLFVIDQLDESKIKQKENKKFLIKKLMDIEYRKYLLFGPFPSPEWNYYDLTPLEPFAAFLKRDYE